MSQDELLYPDLIKQIPLVGNRAESMMRLRVQEAQNNLNASNVIKAHRISVVLRTLNEQDELHHMLEDITQQERVSDVEVIVVDNESVDGTVEIAKKYGAKVINLAKNDFTYPHSMNLGIEAATNDLVFLSVGHARLSNRVLLSGAARHFENNNVGGVFCRVLPNSTASRTERFLKIGVVPHLRPARKMKSPTMGVLGATNCMISKGVLQKFGGFDESYETGGEDWALAKLMLANGMDIIEDPVIAVHHSHGLGPINYAFQARRWAKSKQPTKFSQTDLSKRRPDIDFR